MCSNYIQCSVIENLGELLLNFVSLVVCTKCCCHIDGGFQRCLF